MLREGKGQLDAAFLPSVEMMAAPPVTGIGYSSAGIIPDTAIESKIAKVRRLPTLDHS